MTQSLIDKGDLASPDDRMNATPKWICGSKFNPRPENISELPRVELVRRKEDKVQFLAVWVRDFKMFESVDTCERYTADSVEVKIVEIK